MPAVSAWVTRRYKFIAASVNGSRRSEAGISIVVDKLHVASNELPFRSR